MDVQNDVDFNDLMFEINDQPQQQEIASIGTDRGLASSISNTGIDRDNPQENQRYIQQNQDQRAILQGVGVVAEYDRKTKNSESGLATSLNESETASSEDVPVIIEYESNSELIKTIKVADQPGPSSGVRYGYDPKYDESEKLAESLQDQVTSTFDLALARGYHDQAKIAYDHATSKGSQIKTKYVQKLKELAQDLYAHSTEMLEEDFWGKEFVYQRLFMLKKDFVVYLENLKNNKHKKVLQQLNYKKELTEIEKQIKKNIKTKEHRNNLRLKEETIKIIINYIQRLEELEKYVKQIEKNEEQNKI